MFLEQLTQKEISRVLINYVFVLYVLIQSELDCRKFLLPTIGNRNNDISDSSKVKD